MSKIRVLSEDGAIRFVDKLKAWCKATFALITHTHNAATQSSAGFISASDKTKLDGLSKVTVDSALSTTSTNPVQNKVINNALASKSDITHTHSYAGSSTSGGAATSANKLNTNAGNTSTPVYFTNGVPTACESVAANSATTASKLGSYTVGGEINPMYLRSGSPKASSSTVGSTSKPVYLSSGTITECTSLSADSAADADHATSADSATTATTATKLGSTTVGSSTKPIYLSSGSPTASASTVGSSTKPIYMSSGTLTASGSTVGSSTKPVYLSSGTLTASSSTVGSSSSPVYLNSGTLTQCGSITATTATTASKLGSSTVGSGTKPIYLSSGTATASTSTVGSSTTPVYLNAGTITSCSTGLCKQGMPLNTSTAGDYYVSYKKLLYDSTSGTNSKVTCYLTLSSQSRINWITIYYGSSSGTRRLSTKVYLGVVSNSTTTRNIPLSYNTVVNNELLIFASQWSCSVSSSGYMTLSCTYNKTYNHCTKAATGSNEIYIYRIEGEGST